jgi:rhomboid protease GluP
MALPSNSPRVDVATERASSWDELYARDFIAGFSVPWLTLALLTILLAMFAAEQVLAVDTPGRLEDSSIQTLVALGGLNRHLVITAGEWHRLFTAPLLHGGVLHIFSNSIALLFVGYPLERLAGRLWFSAFFVVGALGGSLMSMAINPDTLTSVGASGAILGLFAALLLFSYRLPEESHERARLKARAVRVLVPSLLPLVAGGAGGHVDYGAHLGGALSCGVLGLFLLQTWPETERRPSFGEFAALIALSGVILATVSVAMSAATYSKYKNLVSLIPQQELPKKYEEIVQRTSELVARYPQDPRGHYLMGGVMIAARNYAGAEVELRLGLRQAEELRFLLPPGLALSIRGLLAAALLGEGRDEEAKAMAREYCQSSDTTAKLHKLTVGAGLCN